jgi:predicted transcriptional regulator
VSELRVPICPKGHEKRVVGVSRHRTCLACNRETAKRHAARKRRANPDFAGEAVFIPNLRRVRRELGITARDMAEACGFSKSYWSQLEHGKRRASRRTQRRIVETVARIRARRRRLGVS